MRNLLITLICILLTSPLAAFDIGLEGVEFGSLNMSITDSSWPGGTEYLTEPLILNNGDVLQVLRLRTGDYEFNYSNGNTHSAHNYIGLLCTQGDTSGQVIQSDFVVGPASIIVGYSFNTAFETYYAKAGKIYYVQMDYAI